MYYIILYYIIYFVIISYYYIFVKWRNVLALETLTVIDYRGHIKPCCLSEKLVSKHTW